MHLRRSEILIVHTNNVKLSNNSGILDPSLKFGLRNGDDSHGDSSHGDGFK
jgi:hypothetical protein